MAHDFGGDWTEAKLEVMKRYLGAYAQALKNKTFAKWYVDAFAGTGQRQQVTERAQKPRGMFDDSEEAEVAIVKDGSVRLALKIDPPFARYIFNDMSAGHVAELEKLKAEFPTHSIEIEQQDANIFLQKIAKNTRWASVRAAVFIDPYGMQVTWETLQALAATEAVDIALLFPTGALNRVLKINGKVPDDWAKRIDLSLGKCDWRNAIYEDTSVPDLFGTVSKTEKKLTTDGLRQFAQRRLGEIFPLVVDPPFEMRNSKNSVLYHLFIICANPAPAAVSLAKKLAVGATKATSTKK